MKKILIALSFCALSTSAFAQGNPNARAWQQANERAMFERADINNDGFLNANERLAFRQLMQSSSRTDGTYGPSAKAWEHANARASFKRADTNGDGVLTAAEKIAFRDREILAQQTISSQGIPVGMVDTNNDGYISRQEHQAAQMVRQEHQLQRKQSHGNGKKRY